jgi:hypothetical protein
MGCSSRNRYQKVALKVCVFVVIPLIWQNVHDGSAFGFSPQRAGFSVKFKEEVSPYRVIGIFVLPDEVLRLNIVETDGEKGYILRTSVNQWTQLGTNQWHWRAPKEPGLHPIKIIQSDSDDSITLNVFVMVPYSQMKGEYLNGYHIGKYPTIPFNQLPIYKPPSGFIEVTEENQETRLSPHFKLKQFLTKQKGGYPKYVVLRERLLLNLEMILERVNERGYKASTFNILSGYRTPNYNKLIGNVKYSRHVWGGAADIFIDENPGDGMMDDLNRDGKINYQDAAILYDIIDEMYGRPWYKPFIGGLGMYEKTASHGPFVHVDVRGFRARWGK